MPATGAYHGPGIVTITVSNRLRGFGHLPRRHPPAITAALAPTSAGVQDEDYLHLGLFEAACAAPHSCVVKVYSTQHMLFPDLARFDENHALLLT